MSFGENRDLSLKHKFLLVSNKFGFSEWQKASELSFEIAEVQYFEGGALIPIKVPGRITYSDLTLDRGVSDKFDLHNWALQVGNAALDRGGKGLANPRFKTDDFALIQRELDNETKRAWDVIGAWPKKYVAGDWDNTADEVTMEQLVLVYDYFAVGFGAGSAVFTLAI